MDRLKKNFATTSETIEEMEEVCVCNTCTCTCTCTGTIEVYASNARTPSDNVSYIGALFVYG